MYNYFIDRGIHDVNCSQYQDKQFVIKAKNISKDSGNLNTIEVMNRCLTLPASRKVFHVYQIGRLHPTRLGLLSRTPNWIVEKWWSLQEAVNEKDLIINLNFVNGLEIPKFSSWYMYTKEGDLLLAVEEDSNFLHSYIDSVYFRVYSNAYFEDTNTDNSVELTHTNGKIVNNTQDILDIQVEYELYASKEGHTFAYVNGFKVNFISLVNVQIGDSVEYVYDSSVKDVRQYTINSLDTFNSDLDSCIKYLVHVTDQTPNNTIGDIIEYHDDVDVHITFNDPSTFIGSKGLYYPTLSADTIRMVTHRDYSLKVDHVIFTAGNLNDLFFDGIAPIGDMLVEIKIRDSGLSRPLTYDSNRLLELYKMDDVDVLAAMLGTNSVLDVWKASTLENSAYAELMRVYAYEITEDLVERSYGYNGLSKIGGDTPTKATMAGGVMEIDMAYLLRENSTVYNYSQDGYLIDSAYHNVGNKHYETNQSVKLMEVISGLGTDTPDVAFGTDDIPLPEQYNYRVYRSFLSNGVSNGQWEDITGTDKYSILNGNLKWNNHEFNYILMVRSDRTFLKQSVDINSVGGNIFFTLAENEDRGNGYQSHELPVPLGQLDIWLNGRSLIENLDYKVVFPMVYILNKKYLIQPAETTTQTIEVRYTGFADNALVSDPIEDSGFIEHGVLSNNTVFDIRDDKVMRITMDGRLLTVDEVIFSEQHSGVSILDSKNGLPYQLKDIIVPHKSLVPTDVYELRSESNAIDKSVSEYLTTKIPQPVRNGLSIIPNLYPVVSPFFATIISHLRSDILTEEDMTILVNDNAIMNYLIGYEYLLAFDPIKEENRLNPLYVIIHPTIVNASLSLSIAKYRFLNNVVRLYGRNLIDITDFITITN